MTVPTLPTDLITGVLAHADVGAVGAHACVCREWAHVLRWLYGTDLGRRHLTRVMDGTQLFCAIQRCPNEWPSDALMRRPDAMAAAMRCVVKMHAQLSKIVGSYLLLTRPPSITELIDTVDGFEPYGPYLAPNQMDCEEAQRVVRALARGPITRTLRSQLFAPLRTRHRMSNPRLLLELARLDPFAATEAAALALSHPPLVGPASELRSLLTTHRLCDRVVRQSAAAA